MRKLTLLIILIFIFPLISESNEKPIKVDTINYSFETTLDADWICYIADGNLYALKYGNKPVKISDKENNSISTFNLKVEENKVFIVWIENLMGSNSLKLSILNSINGEYLQKATEVFKSSSSIFAKFIRDKNGKIWLFSLLQVENPEMRLYPLSEKYAVDNFLTIKIEKDEKIYNPSIIIENNNFYLFYCNSLNGKIILYVRTFEIPNMKQLDFQVLKETEGISFTETFLYKNEPVIVYKSLIDNKYSLSGFKKSKNNWKEILFEETNGLDVARMDYYIWEDGKILLTFSGEKRGLFKQRVFTAIKSVDSDKWEINRLDSKKFENTRAWLPRLAVDNTKVVILWEDSRDIRTTIRMKISEDRGNTWKTKDILLSEKTFSAFRPRISFYNGAFYISWLQFKNDERKSADIIFQKIYWNEILEMANKEQIVISEEKKFDLLKRRLTEYWEGMIKKDFKITYEMHDPFYRSRMPFEYYLATRGPMSYKSYKIEDIKIEDNVALVKLKVVYEVSNLNIFGKNTSLPATEIIIEDTYLFIDNYWYRKFVDALSGGSAIEY